MGASSEGAAPAGAGWSTRTRDRSGVVGPRVAVLVPVPLSHTQPC